MDTEPLVGWNVVDAVAYAGVGVGVWGFGRAALRAPTPNTQHLRSFRHRQPIDKPRPPQIHATVYIHTQPAGVHQRLGDFFRQAVANEADRGVAVDDLPPTEIAQELGRARRAFDVLIDECLAVAELRQQPIPGRRLIRLQQRLEGLVDLGDRFAIAAVYRRVSMNQQVIANPR